MESLRKTAIVKPGGVVEVHFPELEEGSTVEIVVQIDASAQPSKTDRPSHNLSEESDTPKTQNSQGARRRDSEIADIFAEMERDRRAYLDRREAFTED